jgi:hypothetical protein
MKTIQTLVYLLAGMICFSFSAAAQTTPSLAWIKTYSNIDSVRNTPTAVDGDGNIIVAGSSYSNANGFDYTVIKYDKNGNQLWTKTFDGIFHGDDRVSALALDASGNIFVTGQSQDNYQFHYATIKYDPNGNQIWLATYKSQNGGNDADVPAGIALDQQGNIYVSGTSGASSQFSWFETVKYSPAGTQLWVSRYTGTGQSAHATGLLVNNLGVFVTGSSIDTTGGPYTNAVTESLDPTSGISLWVASYTGGGPGSNSTSNAIGSDASGNLYITGFVASSTQAQTGASSYLTAKYNNSGGLLWAKTYDVAGIQTYAIALVVDQNSNIIVTGLNLNSVYFTEYHTVKYDTNGTQLWASVFSEGSSNGNDQKLNLNSHIVADSVGNTYICGDHWNGTSLDMATIKYSAAGAQVWNAFYNNPGGDCFAVDLFLDKGSVYVVGAANHNGVDELATIRYDQSILPQGSFKEKCGFDSIISIQRKRDTTYIARLNKINDAISNFISNSNNRLISNSGKYIIPVVIHIVRDPGDILPVISYGQIQSQIDALNAAYGNSYTNYNNQIPGPLATDTKIQFCLAQIPMGPASWSNNNEPGVMRYSDVNNSHNQMTLVSTNSLLAVTHPSNSYFPFKNYLNIWVVNSIDGNCSGIQGYSILPIGPAGGGFAGFTIDGVVIRDDAFGDNSTGNAWVLQPHNLYGSGCVTASAVRNQGKTLVHEVGHYLDLWHTFQNDINTGTTCATSTGDYCSDTPPSNVSSTYVCGSPNPNSCGGPDLTEDFMFYSQDPCWNTFTPNQTSRMVAYLNLYRANLFSIANQIATGILGPNGCLPPRPIAIFTTNPANLCIGQAIAFNSIPAPSNTAVTYSWNFPGGNPVASGIANPSVVFANPGNYTISLTVTDGSGNQSSNSQVVAVSSCNLDPNYVHNAQWYYGQYANIDFSNGTPVLTGTAFAHTTVFAPEGSYSYSDKNGNLIFYTDGIHIWNSSHSAIGSAPIFPTFATAYNQKITSLHGIIGAPYPGHPNMYFIFCASANEDRGIYNFVRYVILDLNSGTVSPAQNLISPEFVSEGLTIVPHCNGNDFWVISHSEKQANTSNFYVYLLSQLGLCGTPVLSANFSYIVDVVSTIKGSPDNLHVATAGGSYANINSADIGIYDFDNSTGVVANEQILDIAGYSDFNGCSFSPDSKQLYASGYSAIAQFDLTGANPPVIIGTNIGFNTYLQLGPDDAIYMDGSNINLTTRIVNPNTSNNVGGVQRDVLDFNSINSGINNFAGSMPNYIDGIGTNATMPSFDVIYTSCKSISCTVSKCWGGYNYSWDFGNGTSAMGNAVSTTYSSPGFYTVTCYFTIPGGNGNLTATQTVNIVNSVTNISGPTSVCLSNTVPYIYAAPSISGATYSWSISANGNILGQNSGPQINVQWVNGGSGTINVTLTNGVCLSSGILNVKINSAPNVIAQGTPLLSCMPPGGQITLTAIGAMNYVWIFNATTVAGNPINDNPINTTTYTVNGIDINGCSATSSFTVNIGPSIAVGASSNTIAICSGGQAILTGSGASTYSWSPSTSLNQSTGTSVTASPGATTTYTVIGTNTNGCGLAKVMLTVNPLPLVSVNPNPVSICKGSSINIVATGTSGKSPYIYSWSPGTGLSITTGSTVSANPSSNTSYTTTVTDANGCNGKSAVSVNINAPSPISISATPNPFCTGGSVTLTASNGFSLYSWSTASTTSSIIVTPLISTTYSVSGTDVNGCVSTSSNTVTPTTPDLTISTSIASPYIAGGGSLSYLMTVCNNSSVTINRVGVAATLPAGFNPTNLVYNVASIAPGTCVTLTATATAPNTAGIYTLCGNITAGGNTCVIPQSCVTATVITNSCNGPLLPSTITPATPIAVISQIQNTTTTIIGTVTMSGVTIGISPNPSVTIVVPAKSVLTLRNCHLYACGGDLWGGIIVQPGGKLIIDGNKGSYTLIEDAKIGVYVNASTFSGSAQSLDIRGAIFNRNETAVSIDNCQVSSLNYPFSILNMIVTSRSLYAGSPQTAAWPTNMALKTIFNSNQLSEHFIDLTAYPLAFIKDPVSAKKPALYGILLNNVGIGNNSSSFLDGITIGDISVIGKNYLINLNLFDNLNIGINVSNSNFRCVNSAFQYMTGLGRFATLGGWGIYATSQANAKALMTAIISNPNPSFSTQLADPTANHFYDCAGAIFLNNYYQVTILGNDIRSTQTYNPNQSGGLGLPGTNGIYITSALYNNYKMNYNRLTNINNGIVFNAYSTFIAASPFAEYVGLVDIQYNEISANIAGQPVTTQYNSNAITATNVVNSYTAGGATIQAINISNNTINACFRGIYMANWNYQKAVSNSNYITMTFDAATTGNPALPNTQYGIKHANNVNTNNSPSQIVDNNIIGFTYLHTPSLNDPNKYKKGIYCSANSGVLVQCNSVDKLGRGYEFEGNNLSANWLDNTMIGNAEGFVLSINGAIPKQGNKLTPIDDHWTGKWIPGMLKTFTDGSTFSRIWVRNNNLDNPLFTAPLVYNSSNIAPSSNSYIASGAVSYVFGSPGAGSCPQLPSGPPCKGCLKSAANTLLAASIVSSNMTYPVLPAKASIVSQIQVYRAIQVDSSLIGGDSTLIAFSNVNSYSGMGKYIAIEQALAKHDIFSAKGLLSNYAPANSIESNYHAFYKAMIGLQNNGSLNIPDSLSLITLASGCPQTDGLIIYQVRALYNTIFRMNLVFEDHCSLAYNYARPAEEEKEPNSPLKQIFLLYPNPNSGSMFVSFSDPSVKEYIARIIDVRGKFILEKHIYAEGGVAQLDIALDNGMYFVSLMLPGEKNGSQQKIIISK